MLLPLKASQEQLPGKKLRALGEQDCHPLAGQSGGSYFPSLWIYRNDWPQPLCTTPNFLEKFFNFANFCLQGKTHAEAPLQVSAAVKRLASSAHHPQPCCLERSGGAEARGAAGGGEREATAGRGGKERTSRRAALGSAAARLLSRSFRKRPGELAPSARLASDGREGLAGQLGQAAPPASQAPPPGGGGRKVRLPSGRTGGSRGWPESGRARRHRGPLSPAPAGSPSRRPGGAAGTGGKGGGEDSRVLAAPSPAFPGRGAAPPPAPPSPVPRPGRRLPPPGAETRTSGRSPRRARPLRAPALAPRADWPV